MKKLLLCTILILALLSFAACGGGNTPENTTLPPETSPSPAVATEPAQVTTEPETTTVPVTEPVTEPATEPEHSSLYIPGVSVEDVIRYFNEVCLDAEYVDGGDPSFLQKWMSPIYYSVDGEPTQEDLATLQHFADWLNTVEGFPGIYEAPNPMQSKMFFHFCTQERLLEIMGSQFTGLDGAVTFWYSGNIIYQAVICCRTDLDQHLRNSVILEELYNGLGPIQDTALRQDSIIYSGFSQPQWLTPIDELIVRLLYHPQMKCGMNAEECEAVIRQLYY